MEVEWLQGAEEESSFLVEKEMLLQDKVLMHYDPDLPLVLATDSSSYCILELSCHTVLWKVKSGPLLKHPGSLSKPEKKYSQIEKVCSMTKFSGGHHFTLVTDHEPLKYIMDLWKAVPVTAAARIQHGCLFLGTLLTRLSSEVPTSMPIIVMVYLVYPNHEH